MNISSISMFNSTPLNFTSKTFVKKGSPVCPRATEDMFDHFEKLNGKGSKNTEFYSGVYDDDGEPVFEDENNELVYPDK